MAAFGRKHNIPPHVVHYWAAKDRAATNKRSKTKDFFVLSKPVASEPARSQAPSTTECATPSSPGGGGSAIILVVPLHGGTSVLAQTLRSILEEVQR